MIQLRVMKLEPFAENLLQGIFFAKETTTYLNNGGDDAVNIPLLAPNKIEDLLSTLIQLENIMVTRFRFSMAMSLHSETKQYV